MRPDSDSAEVPRILVVNDDSDLLDLLTYALEHRGYTVSPARDGDTAMQRMVEDHPDVVLLDCMLPLLNSFAICRRLRAFSRVPVIMLSGFDDDAVACEAFRAGAAEYFIKPFGLAQLTARIEAVLARRPSAKVP